MRQQRSPQTSPVSESARRAEPRHSRRPRSSPAAPAPATPGTAPASQNNSLTEELMRLMDAELGEGQNEGAGRGPPLPLPDAAALDWATLVHTATRAMLQICEEHQYPAMDNLESLDNPASEPSQDSWPEPPISETSISTVMSNSPSVSSSASVVGGANAVGGASI
ncbi:PREDICTED: uncharacterized protein LOC106113177, partial [Papilio xuthus]